jgi:hypothetical protein
MTTLTVTIQDAIQQSIELNCRTKIEAEKDSKTSVINALHCVDDYIDHATEDDGSWDVWGGEGASEWRLRVVFV